MKYKCSISGNKCPFDFSEEMGRCGCGRDEANDNCPIQKYEPSDEQKGKVFRISDWCKNLIIEDEVNEIWKDIDGYEGLYQVSNLGRVRSFNFSKKKYGSTNHLLKIYYMKNDYGIVTLYNGPNNKKKILVHRIVANAFIPNPNNYTIINHKDENKRNNRSSNLEWCTYLQNNTYGTAKLRTSISKSHTIQQLTIEGILLAEYQSAKIASELLNINKKSIEACCFGKKSVYSGYKWRYKK